MRGAPVKSYRRVDRRRCCHEPSRAQDGGGPRWARRWSPLAAAVPTPAGQAEARLRQPRVLTMAHPNGGVPGPALASWADEVSRRSGGTLEIEFANGWRLGEPAYEAATIEDVRAGEIDMAWVGARAFDHVGVNSFQALVAPMLVDSYELQAAVFEAGIPEQMLEGLDEIELAGIGVLPGPMRKVLGVSKPFVRPADFAGAIVGSAGLGAGRADDAGHRRHAARRALERRSRRSRCLRATARLDRRQSLLGDRPVRDGQRQPVAASARDLHGPRHLRVAHPRATASLFETPPLRWSPMLSLNPGPRTTAQFRSSAARA